MRHKKLSNYFCGATALALVLISSQAMATTYYVSGTGNDKNSGLTESLALRNLQTAANRTQPGDTVLAMDGTYTAMTPYWNNAVLYITKSGTAENPITFAAAPDQHPIISIAGNVKVWAAVWITGASYINFEGFEVVGNAQNVTLEQATATYEAEETAYKKTGASPSDSATNSTCIYASTTTHISIKHNLVHDCSGAGISFEHYDYAFIESNVVFNSAWWSPLDTSGISIHRATNSDNYTGYKNYILNNISHNNANTIPYYTSGEITDGNGIIIDQNQATNDGKPYLGRTLVMGNVVYENGGSGIHAFQSNHVDMYNNTAYMNNNCTVPGSTCGDISEGQIFAAQASDINIYNNIMYSPANKKTYSNWENTDITESHNLLWSANGSIVVGNNYALNKGDLVTDPLFNDAAALTVTSALPQQDAYDVANPVDAIWLLRLETNSPARGAGTAVLTNGQHMIITPTGMDGPQGQGVSIGALAAPK